MWAKPFAFFQVRVVSTATVLVAGANGVVRRQIWVADDVHAQAEPTPLGVMECQ